MRRSLSAVFIALLLFAGGASAQTVHWSWEIPSYSGLDIYCLTMDEAGVGFAATENHEILRTTDAGRSWTPVGSIPLTENYYDTQVFDLAIDSDGKVWAACYDGNLYKSADQGASWERVELNEWEHLWCIGFKDGVGYIGTSGAHVWVTNDNGATWTKAPSEIDRHIDLEFDDDSNPWFLSIMTGAIMSDDKGQTWKQIETQGPGLQLDFDIWNDLIVICGPHIGYAYSTDLGQTWQYANGGSRTDNHVVTIADDGVVTVFDIAGQAWQSKDGAQNFYKVTGPGVATFDAISHNGQQFVVGKNGLIIVSSDNGNSWTSTEDRSIGQIVSVASVSGDVAFAAAEDGTLLKRDQRDATWHYLKTAPQREFRGVTSADEAVVYLHQNSTSGVGRSFVSRDTGATWQEIGGVDATHLNFYWIHAVSAELAFATSRQGVHRTLDSGRTWDIVPQLAGHNSMSFISRDLIWAQNTPGIISKTYNGGQIWEQIDTKGADGSMIAYDSDRVFMLGTFFATSNDGGYTWNKAVVSRDRNGTRAAFSPGGEIAVFDGWKVFLETNKPGEWVGHPLPHNRNDLPNRDPDHIFWDGHDRFLVAFENGALLQGDYDVALSVSGSYRKEQPKNYQIDIVGCLTGSVNAYVEPSTLPQKGDLDVFSINGSQVGTMSYEVVEGIFYVSNCGSLPAGAYILVGSNLSGAVVLSPR